MKIIFFNRIFNILTYCVLAIYIYIEFATSTIIDFFEYLHLFALFFLSSSLIQQIFEDTSKNGIDFHVVVVDGRPSLEGREMLRRLIERGIKCSYVLINAVSFIMGEVNLKKEK